MKLGSGTAQRAERPIRRMPRVTPVTTTTVTRTPARPARRRRMPIALGLVILVGFLLGVGLPIHP